MAFTGSQFNKKSAKLYNDLSYKLLFFALYIKFVNSSFK